MTARILAAALALAGVAAAQESRPPVGSVRIPDRFVGEVLASQMEQEAEWGRVPSHAVLTGRLGAGESVEFRIHTCAVIEYKAVGICDVDCSDLDLIASNRTGKIMDLDLLSDSVPIVHFSPDACGFTTLSVDMFECDGSCAWAVQVYMPDPEQ